MKSLPIGLDFGETAIRMALLQRDHGTIHIARIHRIMAPPTKDEEIASVLAAGLKEAGIRERRCVTVLQDPDAVLRELALPPMATREVDAVAALEADRMFGEGNGLARRSEGRQGKNYQVGFARRAAVERLTRICQMAKLQLLAIDHASLAYQRIFPDVQAVVDMGHQATRFFALGNSLPWSTSFDGGGAAITAAIARAYDIDMEAAQRRKIDQRSVNGAELEIDALVESIGRAIRTARSIGGCEIERMMLVGNTARLAELVDRLERDTGCLIEVARHVPFDGGTYTDDLIAAALPDWALALGAASWSTVNESS